ncbi:MAG: alpha-L-rhamnosidase C-terminal domain-containing protein [Candidatus Spyradocola sp.]|jgi:alpha-L-rhamnosidase
MAYWIWFPHDFSIDLRARVEMRRQEHGMTCPSIWRMDAPTRAVAFQRTYNLEKPGRARLFSQGEAYVCLDGASIADRTEEIPLPAGEHVLTISVMSLDTLPALYLDGDVETDGRFLACENNVDFVPCGWSPLFSAPDKRPMDYSLPTRPLPSVGRTQDGLIDFGREVFGFLHVVSAAPGAYTVYYGESEAEARAGKRGETWDTGCFARAGEEVRLPSRAMRYVCVDGPADLAATWLEEEYNGLPWRASFSCADARLNEIYNVSARTMELCTREFFLDGIKRDRWVWAGDTLQSVLINHYSYLDSATARRTLAALRGRDPFNQHINTILDYTFYWMIAVWEDYFYSGDPSFLAGMYDKMVSAMDYTLRFTSEDGFVVGQKRDWVFVDWADMRKDGELCVEQVLLWKALRVLADSAAVLGRTEEAAAYGERADALRERILAVFWSAEEGTLLHQRVEGKVQGHTRYAPLFALLYGLLPEDKARSAMENSLLSDKAPAITTPYMRFYEMDALFRAGRATEVLDGVRSYWGGMLDLGATSIWEQFDPNEKGEAHYAMYGRPFGRSLCHCWGAGPVYLFGRHVLGVAPTAPGYARYVVAPNPGSLRQATGTVPTPDGQIEVHLEDGHVRVRSTCRGEGTLLWQGRSIPIPPCTGAEPSAAEL